MVYSKEQNKRLIAENNKRNRETLAMIHSCCFAEWIGQNHWSLYNVENGECFWKNKEGLSLTTEFLYYKYQGII